MGKQILFLWHIKDAQCWTLEKIYFMPSFVIPLLDFKKNNTLIDLMPTFAWYVMRLSLSLDLVLTRPGETYLCQLKEGNSSCLYSRVAPAEETC